MISHYNNWRLHFKKSFQDWIDWRSSLITTKFNTYEERSAGFTSTITGYAHKLTLKDSFKGTSKIYEAFNKDSNSDF
jgi:hypothetical protein